MGCDQDFCNKCLQTTEYNETHCMDCCFTWKNCTNCGAKSRDLAHMSCGARLCGDCATSCRYCEKEMCPPAAGCSTCTPNTCGQHAVCHGCLLGGPVGVSAVVVQGGCAACQNLSRTAKRSAADASLRQFGLRVLALRRCRPSLLTWLENVQMKSGVYGRLDSAARKRDRDDYEAEFVQAEDKQAEAEAEAEADDEQGKAEAEEELRDEDVTEADLFGPSDDETCDESALA